MKVIFRATIRKDDCYLGVMDGKVICIVIVEKPSDKPVSFWDYTVSGMAGVIVKLGLIGTLKFMELSDKTEYVVKSIREPRWHLYFLAVDPIPVFHDRKLGSLTFHLHYIRQLSRQHHETLLYHKGYSH